MTSEYLSHLQPFILSWNLRNSSENKSTQISNLPSITGASLGEYPIDGWIKYFLEIPKNGKREDLTGRSNTASAQGEKGINWNHRRTINLPTYTNIENYELNQLEFLIENWDEIGIPDDVPCLAVAIKCSGFYSEFREAQYVHVLTVWNDGVARITSLDWFEGPLEDCITPEWYMKHTSLLNLKDAIERLHDVYNNTTWDNPYFSIFTIPKSLGHCLKGKKSKAPYNQWDCEWKYAKYDDFNSNLGSILTDIQTLFLKDQQEDDTNV